MYPVLFRIGGFEITSFGVLVAVGALVGIWLFGRELKRSGLPDDGVDAAAVGVIGGLIGAKLLWTLEFSREAPITDLLFSRGGLSWFGGLTGGIGTGLWMLRRRGVPVVAALAAATPALAVGHATAHGRLLGRWRSLRGFRPRRCPCTQRRSMKHSPLPASPGR